MRRFTTSLFASGYIFASPALAQVPIPLDAALVGTWSTMSGKVVTGSGFYDPTTDTLIEPALTGISYSFSADGFYEEAYYRAISNPTSPNCPSAIMQWQHGSATLYNNGTLTLTPISGDGRQLLSTPCDYSNSILSRYSQPELFQSYEVLVDPYNDKQRLNMFMWDGTPLNPMWIVTSPPIMLPTTTLSASHTEGPTATSNVKREAKAGASTSENEKRRAMLKRMADQTPLGSSAGKWFWVGLGSTVVGGALVFWF